MGQLNRNIETVFAFLSAYDRTTVKQAVIEWSREYTIRKIEGRPKRLWIELPEGETVDGREWMEHNGVKFVINPDIKQEHIRRLAEESAKRKREMGGSDERVKVSEASTTPQDLTPTITMLRCPVCDGGIIREPVCRGCSLGRMGFVYRYICKNDTDHIMYSMNKEGLDRELEEEMAKVSEEK